MSNIEHIQQFQKLSLIVEGIQDDKFLDLFGTLKDNIQHEVYLFRPTFLENAFMVSRKVESKNFAMATERTTTKNSRESNVPHSNPPQQLEKRREKGICLNCDTNYSEGHK